ncbi:MAG: carotenoid oxygenase family protein [Myxococcales bacterium]|nr:carotenoid oxygenase family protein [Myxococcales bacterium]
MVAGKGWHRAFRDLPREHGFEPLAVEGALPEDLRGTLYRVGPAIFSTFGRPYRHWFDADAGIMAARIGDGAAAGASRVVVSDDLARERAAGRQLYAGYGTPGPSWRRRLGGAAKNTGNTNLLAWGERLYALYEAGPPIAVDRGDLRARGETSLGGLVTDHLSAHPHRLPGRAATYNFAIVYGRVTYLEVYEFPDVGAGGRRLASIPLPWPPLVHDCILSADHMILHLPPLRLRALKQYLGLGVFEDNLEWEPERGSLFLVIPLDDPERPIFLETEACFTWHFANAYADGGELVVDLVRYPDFATDRWLVGLLNGAPKEAPTGTFYRARLDLDARRVAWEERWPRLCEFPTVADAVAGTRHRYVYMAAHSSAEAGRRGIQDRLCRLDVDTGEAIEVDLGDGHFPSEALFVARPQARAEDDGYLLPLVYDAGSDRSYVAVLDAADLEAGPRARLWFDHHIPFTFHGVWTPG